MSQYLELHLEVMCIEEYLADSEPKQPWFYCAWALGLSSSFTQVQSLSVSLPVTLFLLLFALVDIIYYHLIFIIIEAEIVVQRMLYQK